ncbi:MAG: galactitol-1-phosphate 5-dehydrogenase [Lachnospiraceae bacterium]|nr:galactitol-1-phosphate 5-dehydrogenase [Lachnospiraceae bacterium]
MKAYILEGIADLRLKEVAVPKLWQGEVLVQVKAAGICGSDIPRIYQTGTYHFPTIPGHEFSGIVRETGEGIDPVWREKRVGVFPLIPCGECLPCKRVHYEMCRNYNYLGSRTDGGFAEYVAVPVWNLIELPENVSFEAAAMLEPMAVAVHGMRKAAPKPWEQVVVCGLGTIGMLLVMFLLEAGIDRLLVVGNKDFQRQVAMEFGIPGENYLDSRDRDLVTWVLEHTNREGADVFFDCVGKNEVVESGIRAAAPGGRIQLVGNPATDMCLKKTVYWEILRRQLTIRGSWNSAFCHEENDDWQYVLRRLEQGRIQPEQLITQRIGFGELEHGLGIMRDKTEDYVKVMMK